MEENIKELGRAVILQAVKDYFKASPRSRGRIIGDLRSEWVNFLTNGMSSIIAEQLKKNPEKIRKKFSMVVEL